MIASLLTWYRDRCRRRRYRHLRLELDRALVRGRKVVRP